MVALKLVRLKLTFPLVVADETAVTSNVFVATLLTVYVPSIAVPDKKSSEIDAPFDKPWAVIVTLIVVVPAWLYVPDKKVNAVIEINLPDARPCAVLVVIVATLPASLKKLAVVFVVKVTTDVVSTVVGSGNPKS